MRQAQEAERVRGAREAVRCRDRLVREDLGDGREAGVGVAVGPPLRHPARERLVKVHHRSSPSRGHSSSTFFFTASSISIRSGHGRVKPSSGHLRVPSMPIFEPNAGPREA